MVKEADWSDCLKKNIARNISPDIERANSLINTAKHRIKIIKHINESNCNFVFEDYYTSLLEILQAMIFTKGYNVMNHLCIGYYLRDILNRQDVYEIFDDLRYKRNSLTYYGKMMDFEVAKISIKNCKKIIIEIENIKN